MNTLKSQVNNLLSAELLLVFCFIWYYSGNQFYTDSAGLYFPTYQPKLIYIYTHSCNGYSVSLTTFQDDFFKLTIEQFIDLDQTNENVTVGEYHGTFTSKDKS